MSAERDIVARHDAHPAPPGDSDDVKLPDGFRRQIQRSLDDRKAEERTWDICLAFVAGFQDTGRITQTRNKRRFQQGFAEAKTAIGARSQFTFNRIIGPFRFLLSRLSVVYPSTAVLPASGSVDDIAKAKASEVSLRYEWQREEIGRKWRRAIGHMLPTGNVGIWKFYDPDDGLTHSEVVSIYDLAFEPGATSQEQADFTAVRTLIKPEVLKRAYLSAAKAIDDEPRVQRTDQDAPDNRIEIWDIYWQDGRHGVLMGTRWLWKGRSPKGAEIPIRHVRYTTIEGSLYGIGPVEGAVDPQIVYNEKKNQVIDTLALIGNPKIMIPRQSNVASNAFRRVIGEKVVFDALGGPPAYLLGAQLPQQAFADIAATDAEILDAMGAHSTSLGKTAINVESGRHVEALTRNDVSQLQATQDEIEAAMAEHARLTLVLQKAFYTEGTFVRMFDEDGSFVARQIAATDLVDVPEVFVEPGSMFRDGVAQRRERVLAELEAGIITPEEAANDIALGVSHRRVLKKVKALAHARDMLRLAVQGRAIEVFPTDDIDAFLEVFGDFVGTDEFNALDEDVQDNVAGILSRVAQAKVARASQLPGARPVGPNQAAALRGGPAVRPAPPAGPGTGLPAETTTGDGVSEVPGAG